MENGPPKWLPHGWPLFRGFGGLSFANWGEIGQKLKRPIFVFDQTRRRRVLTNWCWYDMPDEFWVTWRKRNCVCFVEICGCFEGSSCCCGCSRRRRTCGGVWRRRYHLNLLLDLPFLDSRQNSPVQLNTTSLKKMNHNFIFLCLPEIVIEPVVWKEI